MKIYLPGAERKPSHTIFVQPGKQFPVSDWLDENGKSKMVAVVFNYGCADVADNLAKYMVDHELAAESPIIVIERKQLA